MELVLMTSGSNWWYQKIVKNEIKVTTVRGGSNMNMSSYVK